MTNLRNSPSGPNRNVSEGPEEIIADLAMNGSSNRTQTLVPAGHTPGMYLVYRSILRRVSGTSGTMTTTVTWSDGNAISNSSAATNLNGAVPTYVQPGVLQIHSDGTAAIVCAITFSAPVGNGAMDVTSWATFAGPT